MLHGSPAIAAPALTGAPLAVNAMPGPLPMPISTPSAAIACCSLASPPKPDGSTVSPCLANWPVSMPTSSGVKVQANGTALPTRNVSAAPAGAHNAAVASITRQIENARTYARMASCLRPLQRGLSENHYRNRVPVSCPPPLVALTGNTRDLNIVVVSQRRDAHAHHRLAFPLVAPVDFRQALPAQGLSPRAGQQARRLRRTS